MSFLSRLKNLTRRHSGSPVSLTTQEIEEIDYAIQLSLHHTLRRYELDVRDALRAMSTDDMECARIAYGIIRMAWLHQTPLDDKFTNYRTNLLSLAILDINDHLGRSLMGAAWIPTDTVEPSVRDSSMKLLETQYGALDERIDEASGGTNEARCLVSTTSLTPSNPRESLSAEARLLPYVETILAETKTVLAKRQSIEQFRRSIVGQPATWFVGAIDVDAFDTVNRRLDRASGDQVLECIFRFIARELGVNTFLHETAFRDWLSPTHATDEKKYQRWLRELQINGGCVASRPFDSGDEVFFVVDTDTKGWQLLRSIQDGLNSLKIQIRDADGRTKHVLSGAPVSIGGGGDWDTAWISLQWSRNCTPRNDALRIPISQRIQAPSLADELLRDRPGTDPQTGLPSTIDVHTEQTADGLIPILTWGPIEVLRPGWTDKNQEAMRWEIARLAVSKGLIDAEKIVALVKDVTDQRNQVWRMVQAMIRRERDE